MQFSDRESLIQANSTLILSLQTRLKAKRFRAQEADNIKLAYMRLLVQALQAQNAILKDFELDELREEIEELRGLVKSRSGP